MYMYSVDVVAKEDEVYVSETVSLGPFGEDLSVHFPAHQAIIVANEMIRLANEIIEKESENE